VPSALQQQLFRKKPLPQDGGLSGSKLRRTMGPLQLTLLVWAPPSAPGSSSSSPRRYPWPGLPWCSPFLIAAVVAGLSILCYAELAGSVPVSGSSYSYTYHSLGEMPAMIVAGCMLLEYGVCSAAVAVGWSQYVNQLFDNVLGFRLPDAISYAPDAGGVINLPAIVLILACMLLLVKGTNHSAVANSIMVFMKVGALIFFAPWPSPVGSPTVSPTSPPSVSPG
jgi:APA family basic amino acid/polyamine antiporter